MGLKTNYFADEAEKLYPTFLKRVLSGNRKSAVDLSNFAPNLRRRFGTFLSRISGDFAFFGEISTFFCEIRLFWARAKKNKSEIFLFLFFILLLKLFLFLCELPLCTRLLPLFALAPLCPRATVITFKEVGSHRKKSKSHQKKRNLLSPRQKMYQIFSETPFWV